MPAITEECPPEIGYGAEEEEWMIAEEKPDPDATCVLRVGTAPLE